MTARLEPPIGQSGAFATWLVRARRQALPHAMVVEGGRGAGKSTVMRWLAAALLCPSELDETGPCAVCRTCQRVAAGGHPDLHVVDRARDDDDRKQNDKSFYVIKVEQVRDAQGVLLRHAVEGRARVLLIEDADCMEEGAQNALLKTLEEPGQGTFLLLEASRPERLLPTVRSRVQRLRVLPLDDATLRREFSRRCGDATPDLERVVALAHGSLGQALLAGTERAVQLHDMVRAMLASTKGLRPVATARAVLEHAEDRPGELVAAREFLWLLRSEVRARAEQLARGGTAAYGAHDAEPWTTWLELTLAAEQDLEWMIPPEQALAACLLQFERSLTG